MTREENPADRPSGAEGSWPAWRKIMLAGALLALGAALARATGAVPPAVEVALTVIAFMVLAAGFGRRMRDGAPNREGPKE